MANPAPAPLRVWLIAALLLGALAVALGVVALGVDDPWSLLAKGPTALAHDLA